MSRPGAAGNSRLNSLGLSRRELEALLVDLDAGGAGKSDPGRRHVRHALRLVTVPTQIAQPGGAPTTFLAVSRNISRQGMSILHNAYAHTGVRCIVGLAMPSGVKVSVPGTVVRCVHRRGVIHEIGIRFDRAVDTRCVIGDDIFGDWYSLERVEPSELRGSVLLVEEAPMDRRLLHFQLNQTQLQVTIAKCTVEALLRAAAPFDLIIASADMTDCEPREFVSQLRARGVQAPIILTTINTSEESCARLETIDAQTFLAKPIPESLLMRAIGEFLLEPRFKKPAPRAAAPSEQPERLVHQFASELCRVAEEIELACLEMDTHLCRRVCDGLRGSAPAMGLEQLGLQAQRALTAIDGAATLSGASEQVQLLIELCRQVAGNGRAQKP